MMENSALLQRYVKLLTYKLTKYTSKEFVDNVSTMTISQKMIFITNLKIDLDNSYIFKSDFNLAGVIVLPILKNIYSFLYIDNNSFSKKSYLSLINNLYELEKSNTDTIILKKDIEKLEQAFILKIKYDLMQISDTVKNPAVKSKIKTLLNGIYHVVGVGLVSIFLMASSLMVYDYLTLDKYTWGKSETKEILIRNSPLDRLKQIFNIDRGVLNSSNPLVRSAQFLQLADTCAAWSIITSLDTMKMRTNVKVYFKHSFTEEATDISDAQVNDRKERFAKLCNLAVNYTINEYSKYNKNIISWPSLKTSIDITFVNSHYKDGGTFDFKSKRMEINESVFSLDNGANAFMLFSVIVHETVHYLINYNSKSAKLEEEYLNKFDTLVAKGVVPSVSEVDSFVALALNNFKYTESEAYKFQNKIMQTFFKGIIYEQKAVIKSALTDKDFDINDSSYFNNDKIVPSYYSFTKSYMQARGVSEWMATNLEPMQFKQWLDASNVLILNNLEYIINAMPVLDEVLVQINYGNYADFKTSLYSYRMLLLQK